MSAKTQRSGVSVKAHAGVSRRYAEPKIKYTDEPLGKVQAIPDFLPSPAELAFREEGVKVTLALSKKSIEFFKSEASKHHTQYQRMIRRLLDAYVDGQAPTRQSPRTPRDKAAPRR
jgi:predicted DNA binding CopG/RHH family protein